MPEAATKLAFIGSHGVGKTTLCYGIAARLKARDIALDVVTEVARRCPLPINRETTREAQTWIFHTQIADEILAGARYDLVICDRSVLDNYMYLQMSAGRQPELEALLDTWMKTYDLLVHVPILDTPSPDGLRSTDPSFQRAIEAGLTRELRRRNLETLRLHDLPRSAWLDRVEATVRARLWPEQLPLL